MDSIRKEPCAAHAVVVDVNSRRFGLELSSVSEILHFGGPKLGRNQFTRSGLEIPIVDLRKVLGEPDRSSGMPSRVIVVRTAAGQIGLVVDAITSVICEADRARNKTEWTWLDPLLIVPHAEV